MEFYNSKNQLCFDGGGIGYKLGKMIPEDDSGITFQKEVIGQFASKFY
jgi:hypothetical protein